MSERLNTCHNSDCGHYNWSHIKEQINKYITRTQCCVKDCKCKFDVDIRLTENITNELN